MSAKRRGGMSTGDLDGDDRDEVVVLAVPGVYVFKYGGLGGYESLWYHSAGNTGWPITVDIDANGMDYILFNDQDELMAFRWVSAGDFPRPWGLNGTPLGETEVELRWNGPPDAHSYRIYRGTDENRLRPIAPVDVEASRPEIGYFHDVELKLGLTYWYSVTSINAAGQESDLSQKASVIPNSPPRLLSAEYVPPSTIRIIFSEPMGPSAKSAARYAISSETGFIVSPSSAVLDSQGNKVIVTIGHLSQGVYTVTASGIRDTTGVVISADADHAAFHVPASDAREWSDLSSLLVYPNPVMPSSRHYSRITFDNLPTAAAIRIYDCSGQLTRDLGQVQPGRSSKFWYLDNDQHQDVASGTYIYVVESEGNTRVGKVAVIR
jgi:hypothetical protein